MPGFIGLPEIILLGLVALLVFGPKRLPEMGRSLGHGLREFKSSVTGDGGETRELDETARAMDEIAVPELEPAPELVAAPERPGTDRSSIAERAA